MGLLSYPIDGMDNKSRSIDYEILGYKIKLKEGDENAQVSPDQVVDLVRDEANKIMQKAPQLDRGEVALLVALQLAQDKLVAQTNYESELTDLKEKAGKALDLIEEVTPTTM